SGQAIHAGHVARGSQRPHSALKALLLRVARAVALGGVLGACGQISGLSDYTAGEQGADAAAPGDGAMGIADSSGAGSDAIGEEAEAGCATGLIACDSGCLHPSSPSSCGSCDNACAGGTPVCAASGDTYACTSGCPTTAPTPCGGTCVDQLTDINNCGGCGSAYVCASGQTCSSGHCFGCGTKCPVSVVSGDSGA